jgi:Ca2+-binding RTX toxin-like protein
MAIVHGTPNTETLDAADGVTEIADTIYGYGGTDTIFGLGGNDFIVGGAGADAIDGGDDIDAAFYTDSTEGVSVSLVTGKGHGGTAEDDTLTSIENLYGSAYDDTLTGNSASNSLSGMQGDDLLKGGGGSDTLSGGSGQDTLAGGSATDTLYGGDGDDTLAGGAGGDAMYGGNGIDTLSYASSPAAVTVALFPYSASGGDATGDTFSGIENLTGSAHDDTLHGNLGVNVLDGGDGDDTLHGGGGADTMIGGTGDDTYYVDSALDLIVEAIGEGTADRVLVTVSGNLNAGAEIEFVEALDPESTNFLEFGGNEFEQTVIGNDGENVIGGRGGIDVLIGRDGDDTYYVKESGDVIVELAGQGIDRVVTEVSYTLPEGADVEFLETHDDNSSAPLDLTGSSSGNQIIANVGNNILNGGGGNDELIGLGGQDVFLFNTELDVMFNVDTLPDFNVADDTIWLDDAIFSAFANGPLADARFVIGTAAQDANDNIIYDIATGALFYDSDGTGAAAAMQFAEVNPGLGLTHLDFIVV